MRWFKVGAVLVGLFAVWLVISTLVGYLIWGVIAALVVAVIVLAVKAAARGRQLSREEADRELRGAAAGGAPRRGNTPNVDDELARLKREMGSW